jgi:photosystem II stability/assembly factor-like uncharacterized protein
MKPFAAFSLVAAFLIGCQATPEPKRKFGPPPPGYIKIRGEAVPSWRPEHMLAAPRGAGRALTWYSLGPRPIVDEYWSGDDDASGRVVSVAPHPVYPDTVYVAAASGGIWKTTDGGNLWLPLTDELSNLNHGCVTLDPSNPETVYVGTGEYTTQSSGDGLFRSLDGGYTWTRIATTSQVGTTCSRVIVDPANPLRIHVTGNSGYARSTDGGSTWTTQLSGSASDLAVNPDNPQIIYVARHSDGIYRSTNGGDSFTQLTSGLPSSDVRRIILAIAPSNPSVLYTAIINGSSGLRGLYRTANGGDTWSVKPNTPNFPSPQGWYDACIQVDPTDEDVVYAGGVFPSYAEAGVIKTTNGGDSWDDITIGVMGGQLHPDMHAIAFGSDGTVWIGNDGGVWKSTNGGQSWINTNATLNVTQNYAIALHPTDAAQVMTGTQDNGTIGREADVMEWPQILSGDGGFLAYDFDAPTRKYVTYVRLSIYRIDDFGWTYISGPWDSEPRNFISPLVMDPNDARTLLGGTNRVWRSHNADTDADWTPISDSTVAGGGTLNAIAVAEGASDTIYTGSSTGKVYVTTDVSTWYDRSSGLPSGQVADIILDPQDAATAYVSFHNTSGPRVLRTDDSGLSWDDRTGDLPDGISARALAVDWRLDPPGLYSGSGVGVYSSSDGGNTWIKDGLDLPNVNVGDLAIDPVRDTISVGTYGRGSWRAALPGLDVLGDLDGDGDVDLNDFATFVMCYVGTEVTTPPPGCAESEFANSDLDDDSDVDLGDFATFALVFTG